jgi:hypothetical protein
LPFPWSQKGAATSTNDRDLPEHKEDRKDPGQEDRIKAIFFFG